MKMPHSMLYLFFLLYSLTGGHAVRWTMTVPARVNGTKGQSVVLPCSFTHPQQQSFKGEILVKWIVRDFYGDPIFQCSVSNSTEGRSDNCSDPSAPGRYSLWGSPQERDLSLLIRGLEFSDIQRYYCRVELDRTRRTMYQHGTGTWLHVSGPAEILNLSVVPGPMPGNSSLECMAEGNPRPTLTCQSSAGPVPRSLVTTATDRFRVTVRVPMTSQDTYVCRATNQGRLPSLSACPSLPH
ncbi:sialic acid binding Ig-like lectin 15, like [Megalops cyprinoides]|uniref:sialic acid binding Ig-like lectin 15, like n=1 Tax=Megalops cyprinoides TaxID=118141 RepID=UPI001864BA99|nr:sialic acid binding Ig-like lectin 15, like [Megalops cyprinoides]